MMARQAEAALVPEMKSKIGDRRAFLKGDLADAFSNARS
jgi:hypothetical protein